MNGEARHTAQLRALLEQLEPAFDVPLAVLDATEAAERHCLAHAEPKRPIASEALLDQRAPAFRVAEPSELDAQAIQDDRDPPLVAGAPIQIEALLVLVDAVLPPPAGEDGRACEAAPAARAEPVRQPLRALQQRPEAPHSLERAERHPEAFERDRDSRRELDIVLEGPIDRRAKVLLFGDRDVMPLSSVNLDRLVGHPEGLRELEKEPGVPPPKLSFVARLREPLRCKLSDRLEHPVALVRETEEALLDERLHGVEVGVRHLLRGRERAAAGEHREAGEQPLLVPVEEVVAPLDRRAQRLLAGVCVATALQEIEAVREAIEDLRRRERLRAGSRELDGERQVVEPRTELSDLLARSELRAHAEELDGLGLGERRHLVLDLTAHAQALATRDEQGKVGAALDERRELRRRLDHLLQVVEQQQQLPLADVLGEPVRGAERLRDRLGDERRIAERGQADPEDARLVLGHERRRRLDREPCLARAAGAGQRDEARSVLEPREHLEQLVVSAHERARRSSAGSCSRSSSAAGRSRFRAERSDTASGMSLSRCSPRSVSSISTSSAVAFESTTCPP